MTIQTDGINKDSYGNKEVQEGRLIYAADTAANDTYVVTLQPAATAYVTGMTINFMATTANTGAATLNVNGLGAKNILKNHDQTLADGDIEAAQVVAVIYDGTQFQMQSQTGTGVENGDSPSFAGLTLTGDLIMTASSVETAYATVASHATTSAIWAAAGNVINFTGAETITAFPNAPQAGAQRVLLCAGAAVFTHGANITVQDGVTYTAAAGSYVTVTATSTTTFHVGIGGGGGDGIATDTIWDAAGDLVQGTGANTAAKLTKGAEGTLLRAGAASNAYSTSTFADTYAIGTILHGSAADTVTGLAAGATGEVLMGATGAAPAWTATPSGLTSVGATTFTGALTGTASGNIANTLADAAGDLIQGSADDTWAKLTKGAEGTLLRAGAASNAYSTSTFADTYVIGGVLHAATANTIAALAPGAVGSFLMSNGDAAALSYLAAGAANQVLVGAGTTTIPVWTASSANMISLLGSADYATARTNLGLGTLAVENAVTPPALGATTANTIRYLLDEDAEPATDTLTANQCSGGLINNYGQSGDAVITLPEAAAGMHFRVILGTTVANYYRIDPDAGDTIYIDGTADTAGHYIGIASAVAGAALGFTAFQTGAAQFDWYVSVLSGTWVME
uniref:Uncharacterized protein n=1 Tax=viral metagenome TaxID=1070528 RepID=A0A6H1Z7D1_9ZZZZ